MTGHFSRGIRQNSTNARAGWNSGPRLGPGFRESDNHGHRRVAHRAAKNGRHDAEGRACERRKIGTFTLGGIIRSLKFGGRSPGHRFPGASTDRRARSPGIGPPVALLTRGRTRLSRARFLFSVTTNRRPSSIKEVSVRPSAAALRLAQLRRSSGSRTVVRSVICHEIFLKVIIRQYAGCAGPRPGYAFVSSAAGRNMCRSNARVSRG